jgi:hypothetical protein
MGSQDVEKIKVSSSKAGVAAGQYKPKIITPTTF